MPAQTYLHGRIIVRILHYTDMLRLRQIAFGQLQIRIKQSVRLDRGSKDMIVPTLLTEDNRRFQGFWYTKIHPFYLVWYQRAALFLTTL